MYFSGGRKENKCIILIRPVFHIVCIITGSEMSCELHIQSFSLSQDLHDSYFCKVAAKQIQYIYEFPSAQ